MAGPLLQCDFGLRTAVLPLIQNMHYDSALRKALVILKTRACRKLSLDENLDGEALVNKLFGKDSPLVPDLRPKEREACRNLFSGMYGLVRNAYMHNDLQPHPIEMEATLANINLFLHVIGDFHTHAVDVMVVDGDSAVRRILVDSLSADFSVSEASSAITARETCSRDGGPAVLVTDRYFPDASRETGEDLAALLRMDDPSCSVIYTHDWPSNRVTNPNDIEFHKPFLPDLLRERVRQELDRRRQELWSVFALVPERSAN